MTLDLFPVSPRERDDTMRFRYEQDVKLLVPIAKELLELAERKGAAGIKADDVRTMAEARHILLASTQQRYLANLGRRVMLAAGLEVVGRARTPRVGRRGGNDVALWGRRKAA